MYMTYRNGNRIELNIYALDLVLDGHMTCKKVFTLEINYFPV